MPLQSSEAMGQSPAKFNMRFNHETYNSTNVQCLISRVCYLLELHNLNYSQELIENWG